MMTAQEQLAITRKQDADLAAQKQSEQIEWLMQNVQDWAHPPIPIRAMILQQRPWKSGDGFTYMTFGEALGAVVYCDKRGVDENSEEFWYDPTAKRYNLSSEGELAYARHRGFRWSTPKFEHKSRSWPNPKMSIPGFPEELGCTCSFTIRSEFGDETVSATVWMGEWYVAKNPNWVQRTTWMLEVRSLSNNIKRATGAAIAANLSDGTLVVEAEETPEVNVKVSRPKLVQSDSQGNLTEVLQESIDKVKG